MRVNCRLLDTPFDPWESLSRYQAGRTGERGSYGATAVFVGSMRDFNDGQTVAGMFLEHYPGMTERSLEEVRHQAHQRWSLDDSLIIHRVGELQPGDPIVLVAVWSAHRKDAFEASRWIMEQLKSKVPLWKKEQLADGHRWVGKNTPG